MADKFGPNVQRNAQILAEKLRLAWPLSATTRLRNHYSHFFHLNMRYGTIAAASIISKAIG